MKIKFNFFIFFMLTIFTIGCVGTIQEGKKALTDANIARKNNVTFTGIIAATATAHNRVRVSFQAATGGSGNFSYLVFVNGNFSYPVASLSSSSAVVDSFNRLNLDVKNLQTNTSYNFSVRVYDVGNDETDLNTISVSVRTLSALTPIFDGASSLENLPGVAGLSQLVVRWNKAQPAVIDTSGFGLNVHAISGYNIYAGISESALSLVGVLNDGTAQSYTIPNLTSGTSYFVRVRAKNSEATPVEDQNITTLMKKTLTTQPIQFSGVSSLSIPKTVEGFSKITINWNAGSGSFDRYKVWIFNSNPGTINPATSTPSQTATITDLSVTSASVSVPNPNATYYIAVLACADDTCIGSVGYNIVKNITTTPPLASFNGIKTIELVDLHTVKLNWDLPDTTQGIYNKIKIFKTDSSGNYNELLDEVTTDPGNTGIVISTLTSTSALIPGLVAEQEYCFVALAYEDYYVNASYPFGRATSLRLKACATLHYSAPNFAGVNSSCTGSNSAGFTVSWATPVPLGIFDYYEIYVKEGNSGFNFSDALSGSTDYRTIYPVAKNTTSFTFNLALPISQQLSADTAYQVGIKTYYNDNGTPRRDTNNAFTINCKTTPATADFKGWFELFAIGPKINGLTAATKPVAANLPYLADILDSVQERIKPMGELVDGNSALSNFEYPAEYAAGTLKVDSSNEGIIKLIWNDFELSSGLGSLYNYKVNHPLATVEYKIYRKAHASKYDTAYDLKTKVSDNDWGNAINVDPIYPFFKTMPDGSEKSFGEFIDYSATHPMAADGTKKDTGTIYYYKVEAFINGTKLNFVGTHADSVVRMILPPANMSFAHRWMTNKKMCEDLGKTDFIDREMNYTCPYNGITSVFNSILGYNVYDMQGDLLVNRYKLGCNFSRGGTPKACTEESGTPLTLTSSTRYFEGGINNPAKGRIAGDCIGYGNNSGNISGKIRAAPGAIFYERSTRFCYVNTSTALDGNGKGTTWSLMKNLDTAETVAENSSKILPGSLSSAGAGWGKLIYSNNAYLPPLAMELQNNYYRVCQSNTVSVNGINHRLRLIRRKEGVATTAMSPFISPTTLGQIQSGTLYNGAAISRDCTNGYVVPSMVPTTGSATGATELDLTKYNYAAGYYDNTNNKRRTTITGTSGSKSSEQCVSMFGLQDANSNGKELYSDRVICNAAHDFCSTGIKNKNFITYPQSAAPVASDFYVPEIDPKAPESSRNGNGRYLSFTNTSTNESMGIWYNDGASNNLLAKATVSPTLYSYLFFSPAIGMMLKCAGTSCLVDGVSGSYDDNTTITTLPTSTLASIVSYNANGALSVTTSSATATYQESTGNTTGTILPMVTPGLNGDKTLNGRFGLTFSDYAGSDLRYGRCATLIEDYADQINQYNN